MPIGTPFHSRTSALCASQNWRTWSGYFVASSYDVMHDYEYHAIRNSAGLIDISPLFKYDVRGRDAAKLVDRVITRDAAKCAVGQALYGCLCENDGAVIQDGTVFRLAENHFRFHLADPSLRWLKLNAVGMDLSIQEVSEQIARARASRAQCIENSCSRFVDARFEPAQIFSPHVRQNSRCAGRSFRAPAIPAISVTSFGSVRNMRNGFGTCLMEKGDAYGIKAAGTSRARCGALGGRLYSVRSRLHRRGEGGDIHAAILAF